MAFTYDITTDRGKVRWRTGDTTDTGHLLEDAEIDEVLTATTNLDIAALTCLEAIILKLSREADRSVVGINSSRSQRFNQAKDAYDILLAKVNSGGDTMQAYSGGSSVSRNEGIKDDTDFNAPPFSVGQDSYTAAEDDDED